MHIVCACISDSMYIKDASCNQRLLNIRWFFQKIPHLVQCKWEAWLPFVFSPITLFYWRASAYSPVIPNERGVFVSSAVACPLLEEGLNSIESVSTRNQSVTGTDTSNGCTSVKRKRIDYVLIRTPWNLGQTWLKRDLGLADWSLANGTSQHCHVFNTRWEKHNWSVVVVAHAR